MTKKFLIPLFIYIFVVGCDNNKKETLLKDNSQQLIDLKEKRLITKELINIRNFFIQDSLLFINNQRDDSVFMIVNLNTSGCIKSWGNKGKGPNEYGAFTHIINCSKNAFLTGDFSKYTIETFSLPEFELISKNKNIKLYESKMDRDIPQSILSVDGKQFIYTNLFKDYSLKKWILGSKPTTINTFEHLKEDISDPNYYSGSIALSTKHKKIVYAYRYIRRIDIMDFNGKIIKSINATPSIFPLMRGGFVDIKRSSMSYIAARATENSFYLLFIGYSPKEIEKNNFILQTYIEEYDWDGNPINLYRAHRYIHNFDLITTDSIISFIGIDLTNENQMIHFMQKQSNTIQ